MARSRNLKPGFFKNELWGECHPLTRLLFAGLWCLADRAGRLEDRPKRIRAEVLPYDDGSVDDMLNELNRAGFILRYQVDGQRFILVRNFAKHQNPHHREAESTIPAPSEDSAKAGQDHDEPRASLGLSSDKPETSRADSLNLIPDSLNQGSDADASVVAGKAVDHCPHQEIIALYQKHLPTLPGPKIWEGKRAEALRARWRWVLTGKKASGQRYATDRESGLRFFEGFFEYAAQSDFLTGRNGKWSGCDIAWLLKSENFVKVLEGKYLDDREAA